MWSLLLLAATVRSFARFPIAILEVPPPCKVLPSICMMPAAHESTQHLPRSCVLAPWLKSYALISASFEACSSVKQTSHRDQFRSFENNPNGLPTPGTARIDRSSVCDTAVALRLRLYVFVWLIFYDINLCAPIADRANHRKCIRPNLTRDRRRATPIQLWKVILIIRDQVVVSIWPCARAGVPRARSENLAPHFQRFRPKTDLKRERKCSSHVLGLCFLLECWGGQRLLVRWRLKVFLYERLFFNRALVGPLLVVYAFGEGYWKRKIAIGCDVQTFLNKSP